MNVSANDKAVINLAHSMEIVHQCLDC